MHRAGDVLQRLAGRAALDQSRERRERLGFACGVGGAVEELGDRAFVVLPANRTLSQTDLDKLAADGVISR